MGLDFPKYPIDVSDGDEHAHSPHKTKESLLATQRGTDFTRRIETDPSRNLYVNVAASPATVPNSVTALAGGMITLIPASTLSTITTYSAATAMKVTRIGCSGTCYAKYQLFLNSSIIETRRSGPERTIDFVFERPLSLPMGSILDVKVTHFVLTSFDDFEATIYGG